MYKMSIIGIANHLYCILWNMYKERLKSIYKRQLSGMIIAALASNRQLDWENETKRRSSLNGFVYVNAWFMFHSHFYVECEWDCCRLWKLYNACKSSTFRSKTIDTFAFHFMEWTIVSALVGMQAKSKLHFFSSLGSSVASPSIYVCIHRRCIQQTGSAKCPNIMVSSISSGWRFHIHDVGCWIQQTHMHSGIVLHTYSLA